MFGGGSLFFGGNRSKGVKAQLEKEGMPYIDFSKFYPEQPIDDLPDLKEFNLSHILENHLSYELNELKKSLIETSKNYRIDLSSLINSILKDQNEKVLPKLKHADTEVESCYQKVKMMNSKVLKNKNNLQKQQEQISESMEEVEILTARAADLISNIIGNINKLSDNNLYSSESIDHFKYPLLSKLLIKKRKENISNISNAGNLQGFHKEEKIDDNKIRNESESPILENEILSDELQDLNLASTVSSPPVFPKFDSSIEVPKNIDSFTKNLFGSNQFSTLEKDHLGIQTPLLHSFEPMREVSTEVTRGNGSGLKIKQINTSFTLDSNENESKSVLSPEDEMEEIKNLLDMRNLERDQYTSPVSTQNIFSDEETNEFQKMIKYNENFLDSIVNENTNKEEENWVSNNIGKYLGIKSPNISSKTVTSTNVDDENEDLQNSYNNDELKTGDSLTSSLVNAEELLVPESEIFLNTKSGENDNDSIEILLEKDKTISDPLQTLGSIASSTTSLNTILKKSTLNMFNALGGLKFQSPTDIISSFKPSEPKPIVTAVNIIDNDRNESFSDKADAVLLRVQKQDQESFSSQRPK